jgi:hypothetical protein
MTPNFASLVIEPFLIVHSSFDNYCPETRQETATADVLEIYAKSAFFATDSQKSI